MATAMAVACSCIQQYGAHYYLSRNSEMADYVWTHGLYAVAPMASLIAAACAVMLRRRNAEASECCLTIGYGLLRQARIGEQQERLQSGIRPVGERRK